jgi:hypothetical protein
MIEYDMAEPVALVDYKRHLYPKRRPGPPDYSSANLRAFKRLGERACIPALIVYYCCEPWAFCIYPLNAEGKRVFQEGESLSEQEWVVRLHRLRRRVIEREVLPRLQDTPPPWTIGDDVPVIGGTLTQTA